MRFILPLIITLFITGCSLLEPMKPMKQNDKIDKKMQNKKNDDIFSTKYDAKQDHIYSNLNNTIIDMADQLFNTRLNKKTPARVILTSFVDLDNLDKTSTFGRLLSESMFNELHVRKFSVTDFRGQDAVSVNEDGEFHISRDVEKLKDTIDSIEYILVGTYVKFEDQSLLINARILDSISGAVLSSARVVYRPRDCSLYGICKNKESSYNLFDGTQLPKSTKQVVNMNARENSKFTIIADDCRDGKCDK